ncbi:MAG: hypothetical protein OHK0046_51910 [Anaerolineae bacterium]
MKRGTIFVLLFILIAGGIVGASLFLQNQPPLEITVAVDPLAEEWVRQAADAFNQSEALINNTRRVRVVISETVDDVSVWRQGSTINWTTENHPDAWIPSSSLSLNYTTLPFQVVEASIAQTPVIFGGYASRVETLTGGAALTWDDIFRAAETQSWEALGGEASWRFVNLAFTLPDRTISGLAGIYSAAAAFSDDPTLDGGDVRGEFQITFAEVIDSVPNFNSIGDDVAAFVARGPATADIGIGPESQWLMNLNALTRNEPVRFAYPEYPFVFDFPVAIWNGPETTAEERAAVDAFTDWLLRTEEQRRAAAFGLRSISGAPEGQAALFTNAQQYGIDPTPLQGDRIQAPTLNDTRGLLTWFGSVR